MSDENFTKALESQALSLAAKLTAALEAIADYDAAEEAGYVDEWVEANAFHRCQVMAREALGRAVDSNGL